MFSGLEKAAGKVGYKLIKFQLFQLINTDHTKICQFTSEKCYLLVDPNLCKVLAKRLVKSWNTKEIKISIIF